MFRVRFGQLVGFMGRSNFSSLTSPQGEATTAAATTTASNASEFLPFLFLFWLLLLLEASGPTLNSKLYTLNP